MAYQNGIVPTVGEYILLIIAATVGSMGAAPVPSAAIVCQTGLFPQQSERQNDRGIPNGTRLNQNSPEF